MSDRENITLPREVVQLALEALKWAWGCEHMEATKREAITALRTHLAAPRPEPVLPEAITCGMPFVIKHYTADLRPTIKGNGFDGLEIGESREEAEEFVAWVNARIAAQPAAAPDEDINALRRDAECYKRLKSRAEIYDGHVCFGDIRLPVPVPDRSPFDLIDEAVLADALTAPEDKT